jgi:hypothetical protein
MSIRVQPHGGVARYQNERYSQRKENSPWLQLPRSLTRRA